MTTKLGYVTIDCTDARRLAPFWAAALGWETIYEADDGAVLADPGGAEPKLFLQAVPEPKSGKNRAHVDLVADDFDADLARLQGLGATVLSSDKNPEGKPTAVLADPQGNEFCLA